MGLWSNILMAFLSVVNPVLGFIGSTIKYITSKAKKAGFVYLVDIIANALPGGFVKDLAAGIVSDAIEAISVSSAVDQVVPFNNIILTCERCGSNSHYYVKKDELITCKDCLRNNVESDYVKNGEIILLKNNISVIKNDLVTFNEQSLSNKFNGFDNSFNPPSLSNKFKNFKN